MNKIFHTLAALIILTPSFAWGQAYCALRDPVETIALLAPEATHHKSIVRVIDEGLRQAVRTQLPPNTLHFGELGRHTLYVVFEDDAPSGFVHVRSEESEWGLVEVAWLMDMNLRVRDFRFQRCRDRQRRVIEGDMFRSQLRGMDFASLRQVLSADGRSFDRTQLKVNDAAVGLAEVVVRCGLKTLLLTELAWHDDVRFYQALASAQSQFPAYARIDRVAEPVDATVDAQLRQAFGDASPGLDRATASVVRVLDNNNRTIGAVYQAQYGFEQGDHLLEWAINRNGTILAVNNRSGWATAQVENKFDTLVGRQFDDPAQCSGRAELLTMEAVITANVAMNNEIP